MINKTVALLQVSKQRLFSPKAAAQYLGIHEDTLRKYADLEMLHARRLEKRRVFTLEDLDAFIESLPLYANNDYTVGGGKPGGKEAENGN